MSYLDIFKKNPTWTIQTGLEELAKDQSPLESIELVKLLKEFIIHEVSEDTNKEFQIKALSVLPHLHKLLETFEQVFLLVHLEKIGLDK